jgi:hypothetical protein
MQYYRCQSYLGTSAYVYIICTVDRCLQQAFTRSHLPTFALVSADLHLGAGLSGDTALVQYLLVMDALNFCFWPQPGLEYEHLARGLKALLTSPDSFPPAMITLSHNQHTEPTEMQRQQPELLQCAQTNVRNMGEALIVTSVHPPNLFIAPSLLLPTCLF